MIRTSDAGSGASDSRSALCLPVGTIQQDVHLLWAKREIEVARLRHLLTPQTFFGS